ncbi:MAG: DUF4926 domain-containing protein [Anaerolineaceae bacterium]|nr:DUF4926 domain-containing protein [Anaerolineaceae bacterium]
MIPELESGRLIVDLPEHGLRTGDRGVVVLVYARRKIQSYEVEFFTPEGETIDVVTVRADQIELAARQVSSAPDFVSGRLICDLPRDNLRRGAHGVLLALYRDNETYLAQFFRPEYDISTVIFVDRAQLKLSNELPAWAEQPAPVSTKD